MGLLLSIHFDRVQDYCDGGAPGSAERRRRQTQSRPLIESGAHVFRYDTQGLSPLRNAAKHDHPEVVKTLLETGAPWNVLSPSTLSAGGFALDTGRQEDFQILPALLPTCLLTLAAN